MKSSRTVSMEMKGLKEVEEMRKLLNNLAQAGERYKKYTIEEIGIATDFFSESRKIGEGGYGPVNKCYLSHSSCCQGSAPRFYSREVTVPERGACPEHSILIYEYMANGSLEDCLFRKKNDSLMCWQLGFQIAVEIATGLLFLHQTKPEPLVHRDLKPSNILLDHSYASKISDVGLARILPGVAENVTQCRMTSTAGTHHRGSMHC
ncbi:hypothetical protein RIF29_14825 [Crotalaria pallida]|uniref:Protein kinase domain-containing protein n=1 Tax=Crotalaria pallida TaxID=3830 RepID=A0AAN9FBZ4_CROPI